MTTLLEAVALGLCGVIMACCVLLWLAPESCPDAYAAIVAPATCP